MPVDIIEELSEVILLDHKIFGDERGFFFESYNEKAFREATGVTASFVQDNHTRSRRGVLRGLHYQLEQPQGKLVRVILGQVYDVAVDLRRSSPTFGKWKAVLLDDQRRQSFWIPPGFAHAFLVLSEVAEFLYKTTDFYHPASECTLRWDDPTLAIPWPLDGMTPQLSIKDSQGVLWEEASFYP